MQKSEFNGLFGNISDILMVVSAILILGFFCLDWDCGLAIVVTVLAFFLTGAIDYRIYNHHKSKFPRKLNLNEIFDQSKITLH